MTVLHISSCSSFNHFSHICINLFSCLREHDCSTLVLIVNISIITDIDSTDSDQRHHYFPVNEHFLFIVPFSGINIIFDHFIRNRCLITLGTDHVTDSRYFIKETFFSCITVIPYSVCYIFSTAGAFPFFSLSLRYQFQQSVRTKTKFVALIDRRDDFAQISL